MRLWGGRFGDGPDARMADFTRSIEVDAELALDDIAGSIAHVRGLGRAGLLTDGGGRSVLERGLVSLRDDVVAGAVAWDPALEDVHMNLETMLTERVGAVGRQAAHRPLAERPGRHGPAALDAPRDRAPRRGDRWPWSGRWWTSPSARATPSCPARPTSSRPSRCCSRTTCSPTSRCSSATAAGSADARRRLNVSPLGAGALAGAGYPLDREATAAELGFDGVTANSLDAVADRDFVVEVLAAAALGDGPPVAAWPRRSPGGRTRASGSCASPTRSPPAPR